MADNVTVDNGTLTDYDAATDDVGGVHYQKVKLDVGGDGSSTPVVGSVPVSGDVAHDAADSGNPVKIGGVAVDAAGSLPVVTIGDRVNAAFNEYGMQLIAASFRSGMSDGSLNDDIASIFTQDADDSALRVAPAVFNGATWDRLRGDTLGLHISRHATAATATLSNVAGSASSVTLLALNTARKGASIHNDSSAILYVKFGTTASTSSYTVKMVADAHYEVPFGYTGRIDGIWASATGNARVTELT